MFGLGKHAPDARCGLILDIGSASVAAALVVSEIDEQKPTTVWTHVERCPTDAEYSLTQLAKRISSTTTAVSLEVGSSGLVALAKHDPALRITDVQVAIAAPWSYTVPKRVTYKADEPFVVTTELIEKLATQAEQETTESISKRNIFESLGLTLLAGETNQYLANGYIVRNPVEKTVTHLSIIRDITVAQKQLVDAVRSIHQSIAPRSRLYLQSFMQEMKSEVLTQTTVEQTYGLLDISGEASEIGIIQNGQLQCVINNECGFNDLIRDLSSITQQPSASAMSLLQSGNLKQSTALNEIQRTRWEEACDKFVTNTTDIISRAAYMTELPEHYLLHTDSMLRECILDLTKKAVVRTTATASVSLVSEKLVDITTIDESRLALSVAVFHKRGTNQ